MIKWRLIDTIELGCRVYCDFCGSEWTAKNASGGILFGSKAACPDCTPKLEADAKRLGEEHYIRDRCPPGMPFAAWCLKLRGGDNSIKVHEGRSDE